MKTLRMLDFEANIKNFAKNLERAGIKNNRQLATFLIEKFSTCRTGWIKIPVHEWENSIDFKKNYKTFYQFRDTLLKNNVIVCQAKREELLSDNPQPSAIFFSVGKKSKRYIDKAIDLKLPERVTVIEEKVENVETELKELRDSKADKIDIKIIVEENAVIKSELAKTNETLEKVLEAFFKLDPPDTAKRRKEIFGIDK